MSVAPSNEAALRLSNVSKSFPAGRSRRLEVLQDISLVVDQGQSVALIGPSGCGKSTLLRIIAGIEQLSDADQGKIVVGGLPPGDPRVRIGFVFQSYSTFPWLTSIQNVVLAARRRAVPVEGVAGLALKSLEAVRLGQFANSYPERLSGGQRQRLAFACALAMDPALLLLDEPMGALDPLTREHLQLELLELWRQTSQASLLVTHDIAEALLLGHRVIVMSSRPARLVLELDSTLAKPWLGDRPLERSELEVAVRDIRRSKDFLEMADRLRDALSD